MSTPRAGNLTVDELKTLIGRGEIDTVIVAFADMQGRLVGKRVSSRLFLEEVLEHGAEACNYLLAVDVEMNTVPGYAMTSWESGYGDFALHPDLSTLRLVPWHAGTAPRARRGGRGRRTAPAPSARATAPAAGSTGRA